MFVWKCGLSVCVRCMLFFCSDIVVFVLVFSNVCNVVVLWFVVIIFVVLRCFVICIVSCFDVFVVLLMSIVLFVMNCVCLVSVVYDDILGIVIVVVVILLSVFGSGMYCVFGVIVCLVIVLNGVGVLKK